MRGLENGRRQTWHGYDVDADAVLEGVDKTGECWYEARLHRLKGKQLLLQSTDNETEAEMCYYQALDIARRQQAKSLELRAARLWQQQDKRQDAYDLLTHAADKRPRHCSKSCPDGGRGLCWPLTPSLAE
ncbi:MAG: hypothetical protein O7G88_21925 [bacterium]|nr:hypothetical protein [bacterium]